MITLPLADIKAAISAAFSRWLTSNTTSFSMNLSGHVVEVTIHLVGDRFNCGIPGYDMSRADEDDLRAWVPNNVMLKSNRGSLAPELGGEVNVWLKGGVAVMFNFHVNLASA